MSVEAVSIAGRWVKDYQSCLRGDHGEWWRLRAERAVATAVTRWDDWREIRMFEEPPDEGLLRLIITS